MNDPTAERLCNLERTQQQQQIEIDWEKEERTFLCYRYFGLNCRPFIPDFADIVIQSATLIGAGLLALTAVLVTDGDSSIGVIATLLIVIGFVAAIIMERWRRQFQVAYQQYTERRRDVQKEGHD